MTKASQAQTKLRIVHKGRGGEGKSTILASKHNISQWDKRHPFIEMAIPTRHRRITQRLRLRRGGALGGRPRSGTKLPPPPPPQPPPPPPRAPPAARARGNARRGKLHISIRNPKNNCMMFLPFLRRGIPETPPLLLLLLLLLNSISSRRNSPLPRRPR